MKEIILSLMVLMAVPAGAAEQLSREEVEALSCTDAVGLVAIGIQELRPAWGGPMPDHQAATIAIQYLSQKRRSPCYKGNLMPQGKK